MAAADPFAEAGETTPRLTLSALFRNDASYRGFYRIWQDMTRGIAAVFGDFLNLPLARTFELYELWCFLRLLRTAAEEFGPAGLDVSSLFVNDAAGGLTIAAGAGSEFLGLRRIVRRERFENRLLPVRISRRSRGATSPLG
jgi:hypothetical protein